MHNIRKMKLAEEAFRSSIANGIEIFLHQGTDVTAAPLFKDLSGERFLVGELEAHKGFFRQGVLLRVIARESGRKLSAFDTSALFTKQILLDFSDDTAAVVDALTKAGIFEQLAPRMRSRLQQRSDDFSLQIIEFPQSCRMDSIAHFVGMGERTRLLVAANASALMSKIIEQFRVRPEALRVSNFCFSQDTKSENFSVQMMPIAECQDMYTDKDVASLFVNAAFLAASIFCPQLSEKPTEFDAFLERLHQFAGRYSLSMEELVKIIKQETSHSLGMKLDDWQLDVMCQIVKLGIPLDTFSYFDGRCSISDAVNAFSDSLYSLHAAASDAESDDVVSESTALNVADTAEMTDETLVELLSEFVADRHWLRRAIAGTSEPIMEEEQNDIPVSKPVPGIEDTLVIAKQTVAKEKAGPLDQEQRSPIEETLIIK